MRDWLLGYGTGFMTGGALFSVWGTWIMNKRDKRLQEKFGEYFNRKRCFVCDFGGNEQDHTCP